MRRILRILYSLFEHYYLIIDKSLVRRNNNLLLIPKFKFRKGGKSAYVEWGHVVGIFQTLISQNISDNKSPKILDIGCGTGLLAIASEPFVKSGGRYTGIDVMSRDINFCNKHYNKDYFEFIHHKVFNATYSVDQNKANLPWEVQDGSIDLVLALSVWTHLNEIDAIYYFKEVNRVLKPGGRAIITFFSIEDDNQPSNFSGKGKSDFHNTSASKWVFDQPVYGSDNWLTTKWAKIPEDAIGLTSKAITKLTEGTQLELLKITKGNWKGIPSIYFQDIIVFEKKG